MHSEEISPYKEKQNYKNKEKIIHFSKNIPIKKKTVKQQKKEAKKNRKDPQNRKKQ